MDPVTVTDRPGRTVSIRLALDDVVVTESCYGAGERGPDPHVHRLHADCFYVLDGAFTLSLADGERVLETGTWVLVPPHVVHAFRNDGPGDVRFLNLHAPGMGFDRYVRELGSTPEELRAELAARYDQHPPPPDGGLDPDRVVVRAPGQADAVEVAGNRVAFLAEAAEALDAMGIVEHTVAAGCDGIPPHVHDRTHDAVYVLEGSLSVRAGDDRHELRAGEVALIAPGTAHALSNPSGEPARFLEIHAPGGLERSFRELAAAPLDPAVTAALSARYDVRPA